ncbi:MAG: tRNA (adenosine(37)-N6)-threonylcarbamoyltransferase complex transferase subunit TsaD [Nitrososphaerota archaeon]|jgi:N6-L-threonylcarbamoyladenine synthase|nr:tRNA (adenosine(37)-N6)-threonylcarbamoyltransferase complex transferase subunit TsaD [Nitrososphaerota archaeon]
MKAWVHKQKINLIVSRVAIGHTLATLALGIESTAHTFGASVMSSSGKILSDVREVYRGPEGSGIHPREASRHHSEVAPGVLGRSLREAKVKVSDLGLVAYSAGPGLGPCLRVGAVVARSISEYYSKPIVPVHHAIGHIELGCLLTGARDPVCLLISGGHTAILAEKSGRWRFFGETLDITIGQLLDQFGRFLGFGSPCGPRIEELANRGKKYIRMPYTVKGNDLSFSGILTFSKNLTKSERVEDVAYSLQETAFAMLCEATERALAFTEKKELLVTGGVAANGRLGAMLDEVCTRQGVELKVTPQRYAGDCGTQIAWAGLVAKKSVTPENAFVRQSWRLDQVEIA